VNGKRLLFVQLLEQEAQLSQRGCAMHRVTEYVTQGHSR